METTASAGIPPPVQEALEDDRRDGSRPNSSAVRFASGSLPDSSRPSSSKTPPNADVPRVVSPSLHAVSRNSRDSTRGTSRRGRSRSRRSNPKPQAMPPASVDGPPPRRPWVAVVQTNTKGYDLHYSPPSIVDGRPVVRLSEEILADINPKLRHCLVGVFAGRRLPFKLTEQAVRGLWGAHLADVKANTDGVFFFHIPDDDFRRQVLEKGHITIARIPLILQQWEPLLSLKKGSFDSLPVWVRLKSIPVEFWSQAGIGAIASVVGKPLFVDLRTEQMELISFARVCVQISASQPFVESVVVDVNGFLHEVQVEFDWKPIVCSKCGVFGHSCSPVNMPARPAASSPSGAVSPRRINSDVAADAGSRPAGSSAMQDDSWQVVGRRNKARHGVGAPSCAAPVAPSALNLDDAPPPFLALLQIRC